MTPEQRAAKSAHTIVMSHASKLSDDARAYLMADIELAINRAHAEAEASALRRAAEVARTEEEPTVQQLLALHPHLRLEDAKALTDVAVAAVRATKDCIADRIRALISSSPFAEFDNG